MERLFTPVSNGVTLAALCAILIGAALRLKRTPGLPSVLQLIGCCGIVAGAALSICVKLLMLPSALGLEMTAARHIFSLQLWLIGEFVITLGFVCFAWGYVGSEIERA